MKTCSSSFLANIQTSFPICDGCNCKNVITIFFILIPGLSIYCGVMAFSSFVHSIKKQKGVGICAAEFLTGLLLIIGLGIIILALVALSNIFNCRERIKQKTWEKEVPPDNSA